MKNSIHLRAFVVCFLLVAALSALSVRLIHLQVTDRKQYADKAERSYSRRMVIPARRGFIVDRHEEILAKNIPVTSVIVDKYHLQDPRIAAKGLAYDRACREDDWARLDESARERRISLRRSEIMDELDSVEISRRHLAHAVGVLARPLGLRREELLAKIQGTEQMELTLVKDLPEDVAEKLEQLVQENRIQGFRFEKALRRYYTAPMLATHVVGFSDHQGTGRFGIEASMEPFLAGRDGYRILKRDVRGFDLAAHAGTLMPPKGGLDVQLSLDMGIQAIVEEELDAAMVQYSADKAAVIVMDPHTGDILALANRPHFDLNLRDGLDTASLNFAVQAIYEPGSTFKAVAVAGALDAKLVRPETLIFCHNGIFSDGGVRVPDHHPYGMLSVDGVLQKSSNIGAYMIARQLGRERFFDYAGRFGFGRPTGIELAGESSGVVRDTGNNVDFSRASYGYAVNVSPLQMAVAYAAIANGGKLMKPRLVLKVMTSDGTVVEQFDPVVRGEVMSERTAQQLRTAMVKVVQTGGTATLADIPGYTEGGKTGTAVKHNPNGRGYLAGRYTVSFAGMVPAEDPAFVMIVVIDDPQTTEVTRYGGTIAAPVFAKIGARVAAAMNLQPTEPIAPNKPLATR
jgi:cell division protein FtsI/penicillin-binding protein 2